MKVIESLSPEKLAATDRQNSLFSFSAINGLSKEQATLANENLNRALAVLEEH